jgi:hypothetical protein
MLSKAFKFLVYNNSKCMNYFKVGSRKQSRIYVLPLVHTSTELKGYNIIARRGNNFVLNKLHLKFVAHIRKCLLSLSVVSFQIIFWVVIAHKYQSRAAQVTQYIDNLYTYVK